jgi:hypothetical protein
MAEDWPLLRGERSGRIDGQHIRSRKWACLLALAAGSFTGRLVIEADVAPLPSRSAEPNMCVRGYLLMARLLWRYSQPSRFHPQSTLSNDT